MVADVLFGEVELLQETLDDFWVIAGYVRRFADVVLEVVEREFFDVGAIILRNVRLPGLSLIRPVEFGVRKVEFPVSLPHGSQSLVLVVEEGSIEFGFGPVEHG